MKHSKLLTFDMFFILIIVANACGLIQEEWKLVEIITKNENTESRTDTVEVRSCCDLVERKTYSCSAGTSDQLSLDFGGSVGLNAGATITFDPNIGVALGFDRNSGESLELDPAPAGYIYKYKIKTIYSVISGNARLLSSRGEQKDAPYRFQATCSLQIETVKELIVCQETCQLNSIATSLPPTVVPSVLYTSEPPSSFQVPSATLSVLPSSKTPTPSVTLTPISTQTLTPTLTQTLLGCSWFAQDKSGDYSIECTCGDIICFCRSKDPKFNKDYQYWQRNRKGVEDYFKELGGSCHY